MKFLLFIITVIFFVRCSYKDVNDYPHFAGENYSICNIKFESSELKSIKIIDSLKSINAEFKQKTHGGYTYNTTGTGYDKTPIFINDNGEYYVFGCSHKTIANTQKISITSFGKDGDILKKFDGLSNEELKLAAKLIRNNLLPALKKEFRNIVFNCDCGRL